MFREQVHLQFFFLNVDKVLAFLTSVPGARSRDEGLPSWRLAHRTGVEYAVWTGNNYWRWIAGRSFAEM